MESKALVITHKAVRSLINLIGTVIVTIGLMVYAIAMIVKGSVNAAKVACKLIVKAYEAFKKFISFLVVCIDYILRFALLVAGGYVVFVLIIPALTV